MIREDGTLTITKLAPEAPTAPGTPGTVYPAPSGSALRLCFKASRSISFVEQATVLGGDGAPGVHGVSI
jgi:hypothetical protein